MKPTLFKINFILFLILSFSCEEKNLEEQLPPITQNGANTFGAIVDGKVFVPKTSFTFTPGSSERRGLQVLIGQNFLDKNGDEKFIIKASNYKDAPETYIYIYIPTLKDGIKNHIIGMSDADENSNLPNTHIYILIDLGNRQYRSFNNSGSVVFSKIDITNNIYSGTFSVKLKNNNDSNDIIEITNGRFDINLNTVNQ